jgi:hypothetical protein
MDIIQELTACMIKKRITRGDGDSEGYEKLIELVKEYTDMICSREEHATETANATKNSTATPTGRSSNACNNNNTDSTPSPKSSTPKRKKRGTTATPNKTQNSTRTKRNVQKRKRDDDSLSRKEIRQSVLNAKIKTAVAVNESRR